jgi:hypothetical protein
MAAPEHRRAMTEIDIRCEPEGTRWVCRVTVTEGATATEHVVGVDPGEVARLEPGSADPTALVRRSFEFLLEREPKESILRAFDLPVIGRYFPEWEGVVRRG